MVKTLENLSKAFVGESQARNRYTMYSKIAKKEGYEKIAEIFLVTADNEFQHAKVLFKMIQELKEDVDCIDIPTSVGFTYGTTAENLLAAAEGENEEVTWVCRKCGFVYKGEKPPEVCPICEHPSSYFELLVDEF